VGTPMRAIKYFAVSAVCVASVVLITVASAGIRTLRRMGSSVRGG